MPNRSADALFQLIKSLDKSEKRYFKLYINRYKKTDVLKIVQLFDSLDRMKIYNEISLLKNTTLKKDQLSNIKAHLYRQILSSLRFISDEENIDIQLHEMMDHSRILYNKGLYLQSLQVISKLKLIANTHKQFSYLLQASFFEKKIETLYITRSIETRADQLSIESDNVIETLSIINKYSNLSLQLYSWYIKHGHGRNEADEKLIEGYFNKRIPSQSLTIHGFYENLYLTQSYCWYYFIKQDFILFYKHSKKWVEIFNEDPKMKEIETAHYIKGIHNLLSSLFYLQNHKRLDYALKQFDEFSLTPLIQQNLNHTILCFIYLYTNKINKHLLQGSFEEGLELVPVIEKRIDEYEMYIDRHRILVLYYKIACLYFGSGNPSKAIDYLNEIINWKMNLRTDLQCYARLLHLISHYELGNYVLTIYLSKSVYRFMEKMENLSIVEKEIFYFVGNVFNLPKKQMILEFELMLQKLKSHLLNKYEARVYSYLDLISWLESKLKNVPVQQIVREKYLKKIKKIELRL